MMTTNDDDDHKSIIKKSKHLLDVKCSSRARRLTWKEKRKNNFIVWW